MERRAVCRTAVVPRVCGKEREGCRPVWHPAALSTPVTALGSWVWTEGNGLGQALGGRTLERRPPGNMGTWGVRPGAPQSRASTKSMFRGQADCALASGVAGLRGDAMGTSGPPSEASMEIV